MKLKIILLLSIAPFLYSKKIPAFPKTKLHFPSDPQKRKSNYPYLSGDTFRAFCDFIIDETNIPFNPDQVKNGDTIFVVNYYKFLDYFFKELHPHIKAKYILITHNYLLGTNINKYTKHLEDDNIAAWLGKNVIIDHPKAHPLPLGINNTFYLRGNPNFWNTLRDKLPIKKDIFLYLNFALGHKRERRGPIRQKVYHIFRNKKFCYKTKNKNFKKYMQEITRSKFILSPEGNGIDCHRTWEAVYVQSIPIVKSSKLDCLYTDLPILIIDDWKQITEAFLNKKYKEIQTKEYNMEKLFASYWFDKINQIRNNILYEENLIPKQRGERPNDFN